MTAEQAKNRHAAVLAKTLDEAISRYLENARSPSREVKEIDNRGSTFYLSLYWAQALARQEEDSSLRERFSPVAQQLQENETKIVNELSAAQGKPTDIGGYYLPDPALAEKQMRPSPTLNAIIDAIA